MDVGIPLYHILGDDLGVMAYIAMAYIVMGVGVPFYHILGDDLGVMAYIVMA